MIANNRRGVKPQKLIDVEADWIDIALTADKTKIKPSRYKGTQTINGVKRHLVREPLITQYHGKCAYCENRELKPEVEHYRPKKKVVEATNHPGYYWLCYEWTNLLPSCRYCNTEGGKVDKFPIPDETKRIERTPRVNGTLDQAACLLNSPSLLAENAYLLHPELDEPELHLRFNRKGKIIGRTDKGRQTIAVCNLNRENLLSLRQGIADDFLERVEDQFAQYFELNRDVMVLRSGLKRVFQRLDQRCADTQPFALMTRNVRDKFNTFIANRLKTSIQKDFAKVIRKEYVDGML